MINHHDILLPNFISAFANVKINFFVNIAQSKSGREIRVLEMDKLVKKYLISNCKLSSMQFEEFNNFFIGRRGMMYSFRFNDYVDCSGISQPLYKISTSQNQFQLQKIYDDPVMPYHSIISTPRKNSIKILLNNKLVKFAINYSNGIVTVEQKLFSTDILFADFKYDVKVRFNQDSFEYFYSNDGSIELKNVELIEVL